MKRTAGWLVAAAFAAGNAAFAAPVMDAPELEELRRARREEVRQARLDAEGPKGMRLSGEAARQAGCPGRDALALSPLGVAALRVVEARARLERAEEASIAAERGAEQAREKVLRGDMDFEGGMTELRLSTTRLRAATADYAHAKTALGVALVVYKDLGAPHGYAQPRDYSFLKGSGDLVCVAPHRETP